MCCMMHAMDHSAHNAQPTASAAGNEPVLDILKRRYALGEIGREQFEEMKRVLETPEAAPKEPNHAHIHH